MITIWKHRSGKIIRVNKGGIVTSSPIDYIKRGDNFTDANATDLRLAGYKKQSKKVKPEPIDKI